MDAQIEEKPAERMARVIRHLGLTVKSEFIPFTKSRNAEEKFPSLNWRVTLVRHGRDVLTTDYSAGCAHCPSYKQGARWTLEYDAIIRGECELGRALVKYSRPGVKIEPDAIDVVHSLAMEADTLDHATFESWAGDLGYDADSREAEKTYRACLESALKLRSALGDDGLRQLREACQDY